jgi:hypothetical protein
VETKGYKRILHLPDSPGNPEYFSDFPTPNSIGWIFYAQIRSFMTMKAKPVTIVSGDYLPLNRLVILPIFLIFLIFLIFFPAVSAITFSEKRSNR